MEKKQKDLLDYAWAILANVSEGDWEQQTKEWQDAAIKWRDDYGRLLKITSIADTVVEKEL